MTTQFHAKNNVNLLPWPASSPVMRPMRSNHQMDALNDSSMHICQHNIRIPNVLIQRYVTSMRRRIRLSIRKKEGHTGY